MPTLETDPLIFKPQSDLSDLRIWNLVRIGKLLCGIHLPTNIEVPIVGTLSERERGELLHTNVPFVHPTIKT